MSRLGSLSKGRLMLLALVFIPIGLLCYQSYNARNKAHLSKSRSLDFKSNAARKEHIRSRAQAMMKEVRQQEQQHQQLAWDRASNDAALPKKPIGKLSPAENGRKSEFLADSRESEGRGDSRKSEVVAPPKKKMERVSEQAGLLASKSRKVEDVVEREAKHTVTPPKAKRPVEAPASEQKSTEQAPSPKKVSAAASEKSNEKSNKKPSAGSSSGSSVKGSEDTVKLEFVRKMIKHAWDSYEKYAWGYNELSATSKSGSDAQGMFGNSHLGASLVDALDTLYISGFTAEYERGRKWVEENLDYNKVGGDVSMFEMNIRFVGACLSMYALTGDQLYKTKAKDLVDRFMPAFRSSGLAHNWIVLNGYNQNADRSGPCFVIAEPGTLHLEFAYLSTITGDKRYLNQAEKVRDALNSVSMTGLPGLISSEINTDSGGPCKSELSLDGGSDSYYEYLIKSYLQSGRTDSRALRLFNQLAGSVNKHMLGKSKKDGKTYRFLGRTSGGGGYLDTRMGHLACFSGGMFALGAKHSEDPKMTLAMGEDITEACYQMYHQTATKIGPDEATFVNGDAGTGRIFNPSSAVYLLRPEVVESYFVLWRTTKDPKYREWAWEAAQAIEKHCRVDGGYTDLGNVDVDPPSPNSGMQQSFFLAETLKYLYLIFTGDDVLPLDKWVFNTEAHPFPVANAFERNHNLPFSSKPVVERAQQAEGRGDGNAPQPKQKPAEERREDVQAARPAGAAVNAAAARLIRLNRLMQQRKTGAGDGRGGIGQSQQQQQQQQQGVDAPLRSAAQVGRDVAQLGAKLSALQKAILRNKATFEAGAAKPRRRSGVQEQQQPEMRQ